MRPILRRDHVPVLARPDRDVRGEKHPPHDVVDGGRGAGQDVLRAVLAEARLGVLRDVSHSDLLLNELGHFLDL